MERFLLRILIYGALFTKDPNLLGALLWFLFLGRVLLRFLIYGALFTKDPFL